MTQDEIIKLWTSALRSGEYKQAKGSLRKDDNFCCLGVLCDLYSKHTGDGEWYHDPNQKEIDYILNDNTGLMDEFAVSVHEFHTEHSLGSTSVLPYSVRDWAGIKDTAATFGISFDKTESLADLNDEGKSFEEIADVIESRPKIYSLSQQLEKSK